MDDTITADILACSCCSGTIYDTPAHNASHGQVPYPHDAGLGMCFPCADWSLHLIYDPIIKKLKESVSPDNPGLAVFENLSFRAKCGFVNRLSEKGIFKWEIIKSPMTV